MLARSQVGLAFYFCTAIFSMVFLLVLIGKAIDPSMMNFVTGIITSLVTLLATIVGFFFGRKSAAALPDPSQTTLSTPTPSQGDPGVTASIVPAADLPQPKQE